jgi:protease YdgD
MLAASPVPPIEGAMPFAMPFSVPLRVPFRIAAAPVVLLAVLLAAATAAPAQAPGDSALRVLAPGSAEASWGAVGRLNIAARGFCTATLIARDRVLTAAHCLFDDETGARIEDAALEFLAGWRIGHAEAIRGIRRAAVAPGFRMRDEGSLVRVAQDLAVLELDRPIDLPAARPLPLAAHQPEAGDAVAVVSYARGREGAPSLQDRCTVLDRTREGVLVMTCAVDSGASGAPVVAVDRGVARIVSVISAMAEAEGRDLALGTSLGGLVASLMAELDIPAEPFRRLRPAAAAGHDAADDGARGRARFLRP